MVLLSTSDLLIAGMCSSFLQSMLISLVFNKEPFYCTNMSSCDPSHMFPFSVYCEVSRSGDAATYHASYKSTIKHNTTDNNTAFFCGNRELGWSIRLCHRSEILLPHSYGETCHKFPIMCQCQFMLSIVLCKILAIIYRVFSIEG